jgi:hypothetical protein
MFKFMLGHYVLFSGSFSLDVCAATIALAESFHFDEIYFPGQAISPPTKKLQYRRILHDILCTFDDAFLLGTVPCAYNIIDF